MVAKLVAANLFIIGKLRNKVVRNNSGFTVLCSHSVKIRWLVTTHFLIPCLLSYPSTEAGFLNIVTPSTVSMILHVIIKFWSDWFIYWFFFRSKDEDFYSNLAATAEDDLSDVSEADVNQMARSLAVSVQWYIKSFTKSAF